MNNHNTEEASFFPIFERYEPTRIIFENGAFTQVSEELLLDRTARGFVVAGGDSAMRCGVYADLNTMLLAFDFECEVYRNVPPEPTTEDVQKIVRNLSRYAPDLLIAIGGGSVIDAAKIAWISWKTGLEIPELFGANRISDRFPGKEFRRIIAVPTTAGAGSEVTPYANIVDAKTGVKHLVMDRWLTPEMAMIDPDYTHSMSASLTTTTALDALTHAIESLLNTKTMGADPETDSWALMAAELIRRNLPRALKDPNSCPAREALSAAATLAGMCIAARPTSLPHLVSFSLVGLMPHGRAVAVMLPIFWRYCLQEKTVRIQTSKLAGIFGPPNATPEEVVDCAADFIAEATGVRRLSDLPFFNENLIEKIATDALANPMKLASCPRPISPTDAKRIISEILKQAL